MSTIRLAAGIMFAAVLLVRPAVAQWRVAQETPAGTDGRIDIAMVENDSGHSLRLFNDETQNVRATFTIRGGFDTMDPGVCPTYRVDKREPERVTFEEGRCRILLKQAEFTLGKTGQGLNHKLRRIMNGDSIRSCLMFAVQAEGAEITTVEGLGTAEKLHPLQQSFWDNHALQCGFCTPGMLMTIVDLLDKYPLESDEEIRKGISGNLCRCTGYQNIVTAVRQTAAEMKGR